MALSIILAVIFLSLGILHLYWALGGSWGLAAAVPTRVDGTALFRPRTIDSVIVGVGLLAFGIFYLVKGGVINYQLPNWLMQIGAWGIPSIFILRAIGERKYLGFFKKISQTDFGKLDSRFISPLCLLIGIFGIIINIK